MKRIVIAMLLLFAVGSATEAYSQGFIDRLGKKVGQAAENAVTKKAEKATEKAIDKATDPDTYKGDGNNQQQQAGQTGQTAQSGTTQQGGTSLEMAYAKSDFVPGDEIMFEDNLAGEKLGEFPSMWDLKSGNAEVANVGGENAIHMERETLIMPFMKEANYLPDEFTIEFDIYVPTPADYDNRKIGMNSRYNIDLLNTAGKVVFRLFWYNSSIRVAGRPLTVSWEWLNDGASNKGEAEYMFNFGGFNHVAISFNKRAMKFYLNGARVVNIPRCDAPARFQIFSYQGESAENRFIKNVRIAKGAVPLYDRMMSDGKFITYGITFDVGKSTIKPESMGEINRIVQLMNENPTLKFSVEGHTDSTGNPASNQTLSEARSKAIVDKLVSMGISADRLTASGKGQNNPIADNSTDEGRAKNRRVEFVKI